MAEGKSIGAAYNQIKTAVPKMVSQIKQLAAAEIKPALKHGGIGTALVGAVAVIGATLLFLVLITIGFAFSIIYNQVLDREPVTALTLGFLTLSVLCLILIAVIALLAFKQFKKVKAPQATIAETKASLSSITTALEKGFSGDTTVDGQLDRGRAVAADVENLPEY